jgi:GH24 family phage-related lysozyme (muramidase)
MQKHWVGIEHAVPENVPQSVKAGMLSVAYNVGVSGFLWQLDARGRRVPSRFIQPLATGDWEAACAAIGAPWRGKHGIALGYKATVKGKPVRGLENRRKAEERMCRQDLR